MHDTADTPYSISFHDQYTLLTIPTFNYTRPKQYKEFIRDSFHNIAEKNTDILILDLRGNYGGTPTPTVELFLHLIDEPLPFFAQDNPFYLNRWKKPLEPAANAFEGELYVLIDEACFSMNSFLLSILTHHNIGTVVGRSSSGGYMCSDASKNAALRNTGLRLRYSTQVFKTAVDGQTPGIGIEPDIHVTTSIEDYLAQHDPVLEAALSVAGIR
jgi:C-terminal processing protease CtpA/Prc